MLTYVFLAVCVCGAFGSPSWDDLRVTWSLNPFNSWAFNSVPRETSDSMKDFTLRDDQCATPNAKFLGKRYWYKGDPAVILLYDKNGFIAGIQTSLPKSSYTPYPSNVNNPYVEDGEFWTLTTYFVDPSTICGNGRSAEEFKNQGTGTGLWWQTGPNPLTDFTIVPTEENDVKQTKWTFGKCFWTMGNHYWFNVTKDMPCEKFFPSCLLYNKGKLSGFCFSINGALPSQRYEHPTAQIANKFLNPVPDCFFSDPTYQTLSTIHVYFISNPRTGSLC